MKRSSSPKKSPSVKTRLRSRVRVLKKTSEIPIYYRVILKNGEWRVYDVVIEGVSLISNYRTQFKDILSNKPPESLLETLREKVGKG